MTGTIPSQLGLLSPMLFLLLEDNNLTGSIPTELGQSMDPIWVDMSHNQLTGLLPSELGLWSDSISYFSAANNLLSGELPLVFSPNLQYLNISGNNLHGVIQEELCMLEFWYGLDFDCSDALCGCSCNCSYIVDGAFNISNATDAIPGGMMV